MELSGRLVVLLGNQSFQSLVSWLSFGPNLIAHPFTIIIILQKGRQVTWQVVPQLVVLNMVHFVQLCSSSYLQPPGSG